MKNPRKPLDERARQRRQLLRGTAAAALGGLAAGLAGCGGGSDGAAAEAAAAGGRQQPLRGVDSGGTGKRKAFFSGPIDATMPLTLNGVRFDTETSQITDAEGHAVAVGDLQPGMIGQIEADAIRSRGAAPRARALTVQIGEQLLGPVASVDAANGRFTVLGQTAVVTADTLFGAALGGGLAGLAPDRLVRVWGQLDPAGGRVVATRIDAIEAGATDFVVRGVVTALDRAAGQAAIGALLVGFATGDASVVASDVIVGAVVRARLRAPTAGEPPTLLAMRGDALRLPDRVSVEMEGRVTRIVTSRRFDVDGIEVDASAAAVQGLAQLALGARVEVHGRSSLGVVRATSVAVEADEPVELEGAIVSADAARQTFVLRGVTVAWTAGTSFTGGAPALLTARRRVAVVGRWSADRAKVDALRIHVEA